MKTSARTSCDGAGNAKGSCKGAGEKRGVEEALGGGTSFASTFTAGLSTITVRPLEEDRGVRSAEPVARKTSAKTSCDGAGNAKSSCKGAGEKRGVEALGGGTSFRQQIYS